MSKNRYESLVTIPGIEEGQVLDSVGGTEWYAVHRKGVPNDIRMRECFLIDNSNSFRLIEEKEFTRRDMLAYVKWYTTQTDGDCSVEAWIKYVKELPF